MSWSDFQDLYCSIPSLDLSVDISRMGFRSDYLDAMADRMDQAFVAMRRLEKGDVVNVDEKRMVGHYWLRAPEFAPTPEIRNNVESGIREVVEFAGKVHAGDVHPTTKPRFTRVLSIGIGGSALGPMLVADSLGHPTSDRMQIDFVDNTDPEGISRILAVRSKTLDETLCIVTSKSGSTPETRNGMVLIADAYKKSGLDFGRHAVAITESGSKLDEHRRANNWLAQFPMYDWIGGRTSVLSAVGLLPAALQGIDIQGMLDGAAKCDAATRVNDTRKNPAALLALAWYHGTNGKGDKAMVVLPYKDRLVLFSKYLQQLVMESLGKTVVANGTTSYQGITVYGNKGSTDQHAYVQQLRDGLPNFFATFIRVLEAGGTDTAVETGVSAGDFLHGFLLGTRSALSEGNRPNLTITIPRVDALRIGALIALFERAVGFYATLVGINAYHQPGVEAGKKAAAAVLNLQKQVIARLSDTPATAQEIAGLIGEGTDPESVYLLLEHLAANKRATLIGERRPQQAKFAKGSVII